MELDVERAVPDQRLEPSFKRRLAVLVGAVAISAALLAFLESENSRKESEALTDASRSALEVFVKLGASGPRLQFELDAARESLLLDASSSARAAGSSIELLPLRLAIAQSAAENRASRELLELSRRLKRLPASAAGLDRVASEALRLRTQAQADAIYAAQDARLEQAETYGTRQERAMYGLSLVAVAASLLGLAGLLGSGRGGRMALSSAAVALIVAFVTGASGYVV